MSKARGIGGDEELAAPLADEEKRAIRKEIDKIAQSLGAWTKGEVILTEDEIRDYMGNASNLWKKLEPMRDSSHYQDCIINRMQSLMDLADLKQIKVSELYL